MSEQDFDANKHDPPRPRFTEGDFDFLMLAGIGIEPVISSMDKKKLALADIQIRHREALRAQNNLLQRAAFVASAFNVKNEKQLPMPDGQLHVQIFLRTGQLPDKRYVQAMGVRFTAYIPTSEGALEPNDYDAVVSLDGRPHPPFTDEDAALVWAQVNELSNLRGELGLEDNLTRVRETLED